MQTEHRCLAQKHIRTNTRTNTRKYERKRCTGNDQYTSQRSTAEYHRYNAFMSNVPPLALVPALIVRCLTDREGAFNSTFTLTSILCTISIHHRWLCCL